MGITCYIQLITGAVRQFKMITGRMNVSIDNETHATLRQEAFKKKISIAAEIRVMTQEKYGK